MDRRKLESALRAANSTLVAAEINAQSLERKRKAQSALVDQLEQSLRHLKDAHGHLEAEETTAAIAQLQATVDQAVDERNSLVIESVAANLKLHALVLATPGLDGALRLQALLESLQQGIE